MSVAYPPVLDRLDRGAPVRLAAVGGGCIAQAQVAEFADGSSVFVKRKAGMLEGSQEVSKETGRRIVLLVE